MVFGGLVDLLDLVDDFLDLLVDGNNVVFDVGDLGVHLNDSVFDHSFLLGLLGLLDNFSELRELLLERSDLFLVVGDLIVVLGDFLGVLFDSLLLILGNHTGEISDSFEGWQVRQTSLSAGKVGLVRFRSRLDVDLVGDLGDLVLDLLDVLFLGSDILGDLFDLLSVLLDFFLKLLGLLGEIVLLLFDDFFSFSRSEMLGLDNNGVFCLLKFLDLFGDLSECLFKDGDLFLDLVDTSLVDGLVDFLSEDFDGSLDGDPLLHKFGDLVSDLGDHFLLSLGESLGRSWVASGDGSNSVVKLGDFNSVFLNHSDDLGDLLPDSDLFGLIISDFESIVQFFEIFSQFPDGFSDGFDLFVDLFDDSTLDISERVDLLGRLGDESQLSFDVLEVFDLLLSVLDDLAVLVDLLNNILGLLDNVQLFDDLASLVDNLGLLVDLSGDIFDDSLFFVSKLLRFRLVFFGTHLLFLVFESIKIAVAVCVFDHKKFSIFRVGSGIGLNIIAMLRHSGLILGQRRTGFINWHDGEDGFLDWHLLTGNLNMFEVDQSLFDFFEMIVKLTDGVLDVLLFSDVGDLRDLVVEFLDGSLDLGDLGVLLGDFLVDDIGDLIDNLGVFVFSHFVIFRFFGLDIIDGVINVFDLLVEFVEEFLVNNQLLFKLRNLFDVSSVLDGSLEIGDLFDSLGDLGLDGADLGGHRFDEDLFFFGDVLSDDSLDGGDLLDLFDHLVKLGDLLSDSFEHINISVDLSSDHNTLILFDNLDGFLEHFDTLVDSGDLGLKSVDLLGEDSGRLVDNSVA